MKYYIILAASLLLFGACTDTKKQEKESLNEVIKIHDEAMAKSEEVMKNKMFLDSVVKVVNTKEQPQVTKVITQLETADKSMEDWMHQFNADNTGKSHEEIMTYLANQKTKVSEVNTQLNSAITQSNQFINTFKK